MLFPDSKIQYSPESVLSLKRIGSHVAADVEAQNEQKGQPEIKRENSLKTFSL